MKTQNTSWRSFNYALWPLMLAVLLTVAYKVGDGYVMENLIQSTDKLVSTLVYLTMGSLTGLVINYILCQTPLGKLVDGSFKSIKGISGKAHRTAMISGTLSAIATGIYLWSFRTLDPSIVIPLTSLAVLYIAVVDAIRGKIQFSKLIPSVLLVIVGVSIASYKETANFSLTGSVLLTVLLGYNIVNAISELVSKDGVDDSDAISYGFWRFFWLTVAALIIAVGTSVVMGTFLDYIKLFVASLSAVPFIALLMVVVFFANGWANKGLAISNATTKNLVMTSQVILSVFATVLVSTLWPAAFPSAPASVVEWTLRVFGAVLLMWGIVRIRRL